MNVETVLLGIIALASVVTAIRGVTVNVPPPEVVEVHHHEKTHTREVKQEAADHRAPLRHQHRTR